MTEKEYYIKAIELYGVDAQYEMLQEEAAELIVAINHFRRGRVGIKEVMKEIADVYLLSEQVKSCFFEEVYDNAHKEKYERFTKRIDDATNENS